MYSSELSLCNQGYGLHVEGKKRWPTGNYKKSIMAPFFALNHGGSHHLTCKRLLHSSVHCFCCCCLWAGLVRAPLNAYAVNMTNFLIGKMYEEELLLWPLFIHYTIYRERRNAILNAVLFYLRTNQVHSKMANINLKTKRLCTNGGEGLSLTETRPEIHIPLGVACFSFDKQSRSEPLRVNFSP